MFSNKPRHWSSLIWLLLTSMAAAQPMRAQAKEVTLALVNALPDTSANATIVRESGSKGRTLLLIRDQKAAAIALATAVASLERSRIADGDPPKSEIVITLHGLRTVSSMTADEQRLAQHYVERLQKMEQQNLAGFGRAKVLVIPMESLRKISDG